MTQDLGPWSWRALALSGLVTGGLMVPLTWGVSRFRTGLDAEMNQNWAMFSFLDVAVGVAIIGGVSVVLLAFGYGFARRLRLGRRGFLLAASLPAALVLFLFQLGWGGGFADLTYAPAWLMPASIAAGLAFGARSYLDAARLFKREPEV